MAGRPERARGHRRRSARRAAAGAAAPGARVRAAAGPRARGQVRMTDSIHHHHPEGVVYRSFCLNSGTVAVSKVTSRRWWCIESIFPQVRARALAQGPASGGRPAAPWEIMQT